MAAQVANVDDNITAISFVALGTSVPDRTSQTIGDLFWRCHPMGWCQNYWTPKMNSFLFKAIFVFPLVPMTG